MSLSRILKLAIVFFSMAQFLQASATKDHNLKQEITIKKIEVRSKDGNASENNSSEMLKQAKSYWDRFLDKSKEIIDDSTESVSAAASSAWNGTKRATKAVGDKATGYVKDYFKSTWEEAGKNVKEQQRQGQQQKR